MAEVVFMELLQMLLHLKKHCRLRSKSSIDSTGWKPLLTIDKAGGAYGQVSSKAEIPFNQLPAAIQKVILTKTKTDKSSTSKLDKAVRYKKPDYVPPYVQDWDKMTSGKILVLILVATNQ